jgi:hypothetical protein
MATHSQTKKLAELYASTAKPEAKSFTREEIAYAFEDGWAACMADVERWARENFTKDERSLLVSVAETIANKQPQP